MIATLHHRGWHYLLLGALGGLMFFLNLGGPTLWDLDEGRNITCALEMREADNWIVPTFNGQLRDDKPALLYWLQIFSFQAFGVNEFAARFPSALAALITVLLTYELARSMFTRTTGLLAGVIVATTPMLCGAGHFANPDSLLNVFTVMTLTIFWLGLAQRRWWWFALLGIASGLAVLAKGPVGVVLPSAVGVLFLLWQRQWRFLWERRWCIACWTFVGTALPWYIWVTIETKGDFPAGFFGKHHWERGTSTLGDHVGFPGYYLVVLLLGTLPWSIFFGAAGWYGFWSSIRCPWLLFQNVWSRASEVGAAEGADCTTDRPAAYRLLGCWVLIYVVCFSIAATKLPNYILPAVAPCAILLGRFLHRWCGEACAMPRWVGLAATVWLFLLGIGFSLGLAAVGGVGELPALRGRYLPGLEFWAMLGIAPIVTAAAGWWFLRQDQPRRFVLALSLGAVVFLAPASVFGLAFINRHKAPQALVEEAKLLRRDEDIRIGCWKLEYLPSLNFYVQRNVEYIEDEGGIARFLGYRLPVFLFISAEEWERVAPEAPDSVRVIARHYDFYQHHEVVVVTNR